MAPLTLEATAVAIGVQGGRCAHGQKEAIEVEAVIWIGIAVIVVIAALIAVTSQHGNGGTGRQARPTNTRSGDSGRRAGYGSSGWGVDGRLQQLRR